MTAPHYWIAVYALAPIVALVVIALCSKLWLKRKGRLAAEQAQYHEAKMRAEMGFQKVECAGTALDPTARRGRGSLLSMAGMVRPDRGIHVSVEQMNAWRDSPRLQRLAALCDQLRNQFDVAECERLVSRFVYDEHAALEDEMFAAIAAPEASELEVALAGITPDNLHALAFEPESDQARELAYAERMKPHETVEEALEYYVLHEHMKLDEALLQKFGFTPERSRQLYIADQVRELMNHYSFPERLTIDDAERLQAEFHERHQQAIADMLRGGETG